MAKRRLLKKDISYIAGDLFTEVLVLVQLVPGIEQEKAEEVLNRIMDMQDEYVKRAHQPSGKDNKTIVKDYYKKLLADLQAEVESIVDEIQGLSKGKAE